MRFGNAGLNALGGLVIDAVLWVVEKIRDAAYAPVMGRYYEHKGNPIDIDEEDSGCRWLSIDDVRRSLPDLVSTPTLQTLYPTQVIKSGKPCVLRIEAQTLAQHLSRAQDDQTIRFCRWLQREVIFPAKNKARIARNAG